MDQPVLPERLAIPSGMVKARLLCGLPTLATLLLGLLLALPWVWLHTFWHVLGVAPLWVLMAYHAKKDALFLDAWRAQMNFKPYYHGR
jgi:type IV secretory pathway VirB3-like protein